MIKKLLFINHSSAETGGAEDDFESMLKFLFDKKDKYILHAMFPNGPRSKNYADYCQRWGNISWGFFPVIYNGIWNYLKYLLKFFIQFYQIIKFIWKSDYDLCIVNVAVLLWPIIILKCLRFRVVVLIKETIEPKWLRKLIYLILSLFADYFIPNSKVIEKEFIEFTNNKNIRTVYSAVEDIYDLEITEIEFEKNVGKDIYQHLVDQKKIKFLIVGNIKKIKNQILILESLNLLKEKPFFEFIDFFFVGDTAEEKDYYNSLIRYSIEKGLVSNTHFVGKLNKQFLVKMYEYIDVLLISSISEGIPLVLVYALKFKKLVLSTNVGGISDVIQNKENGLLVNTNKEEYSAAIEYIYSQFNQLSLIKNNAYNTYIEKFNLELNMNKLEEILNSIKDTKLP